MTNYTIQYFIDKFEAIPDNLWITGDLALDNMPGCHCVLGHCGVRDSQVVDDPLYDGGWLFTDESKALIAIFGGDDAVLWIINDSISQTEYPGQTPKARILNQLFLKKYPEVVQKNG